MNSPITQLQGVRLTIEGEAHDLLAAADAYETHARELDAEAERLRTLAREAREQEQNLRMITEASFCQAKARTTRSPDAVKLCPRCGSPCTKLERLKFQGNRGRWCDTKRWACTVCTWSDPAN